MPRHRNLVTPSSITSGTRNHDLLLFTFQSRHLPRDPVTCPGNKVFNILFPLVLTREQHTPDHCVPESEKGSVCCSEGTGSIRYPPGLMSVRAEDEDSKTRVAAAEFRTAGVDGTDTLAGFRSPEKWAGEGLFLRLYMSTEEFLFIRVNNNNPLLTVCEPYPEFKGPDLLLYTDYFTHRAAAVTTAPACKCHRDALPCANWRYGNENHTVRTAPFAP